MARRLLAAVVLLLLGAAPAAAGAPTDRLRTLFDRANRLILAPEPDGGLEERVTAVRGLVNDVFDFDGAAALALGRHWEPLPPPARAAFTRLYADVVERAYLAWVGGRARVGEGGVTIRWIDETVEGDAASVTSVMLTRTGGELPLEYRMVRRGDDWLVRDVVVDGLSLAANYHVQFERVLQMGSYDELVARLRDKAGPVARAQATAVNASAIRAMVAAPAPAGPPLPAAIAPTVAAADTPSAADEPSAADTPRAAGNIVAELREPLPGAVASDATPSILTPPTATASARVTPTPRVAVPPAPPALVVPPAPSRREFWVQVGAFRSADAATRLVQRLRRHAVTIAMSGDHLVPLARVLVGPFAERASAAAAVRALQASGIAAFITDTPE